MNILICDDEKIIREQLSSIIAEKYKDSKIYHAASSDDIRLLCTAESLHLDIVFMDIALENESGVDVSNAFADIFAESKIIFISGYPEKVPSIFFNVQPFGFVNKPFNEALVYRYIDKAVAQAESEKRYITCFENGKELRILFANIMYIESMGRKLHIKTENGVFLTFGKIDSIESLPASFVRCHKSFVVNMNFIVSYVNHRFTMKDKKEISVSRARQSEAESGYYIFRGGIV